MMPIIVLAIVFIIILALMGYGTWLVRADCEEIAEGWCPDE